MNSKPLICVAGDDQSEYVYVSACIGHFFHKRIHQCNYTPASNQERQELRLRPFISLTLSMKVKYR